MSPKCIIWKYSQIYETNEKAGLHEFIWIPKVSKGKERVGKEKAAKPLIIEVVE